MDVAIGLNRWSSGPKLRLVAFHGFQPLPFFLYNLSECAVYVTATKIKVLIPSGRIADGLIRPKSYRK